MNKEYKYEYVIKNMKIRLPDKKVIFYMTGYWQWEQWIIYFVDYQGWPKFFFSIDNRFIYKYYIMLTWLCKTVIGT